MPRTTFLAALVFAAMLSAAVAGAGEAAPADGAQPAAAQLVAGAGGARQDLGLSPELQALLRAEMAEVAKGVQGIPAALASGDWKSIAQTGANIRASYILEKNLTPAQSEELEKVLPADFKRLDAEFHARAERLGAAAETGDAELVAHHYARLLENCAACHTAYARTRFPAFSAAPHRAHKH